MNFSSKLFCPIICRINISTCANDFCTEYTHLSECVPNDRVTTSKYSANKQKSLSFQNQQSKIVSSLPVKSALANNGPLELIAPCTKCGYFSRNQAAREPEYEPPNAIHLCVMPYNSFMDVIKYAKSANACSDDKYCKFSVDKSLFYIHKHKGSMINNNKYIVYCV